MNDQLSPERVRDSRGAIIEHYGPGEAVPTTLPLPPLEAVSAASLAGRPVPKRMFLDSSGLFPCKNVTMLSGDGGTGKSLLALQLAAAVATGSAWFGISVNQGAVLYLSAEDDLDETHVRLFDICQADGLNLALMTGLEICSLAGKDAVLVTESNKNGGIEVTPLFERLKRRMAVTKPSLLVLDNLADIFCGNENVRHLARQFIGALRGLAIEFDCSVLLLAHPSLSGMTSGSGTSGNTAWNNSVRSRLYLVRDIGGKGGEADLTCRILRTMKANYGATGSEIAVRWEAGRFVRTDVDCSGSLDATTRAQQAERVFMQLLGWHEAKGISISPHHSSSYAPTVFTRHPQSEGVSKELFAFAMNVLLESQRIKVEQVGPPSRRRHVLVTLSDRQEC